MDSWAGEVTVTLSINACPDEFSRAAVWLEDECRLRDIPSEHQHRLDLCLDEALANVLRHGGDDAQAMPVELTLKFGEEGGECTRSMVLTISAGGVAFDPTGHVQRAPPGSLEEAEPGGLGVLMMRSNSDEMHYRREGNRNHTRFVVRWNDVES